MSTRIGVDIGGTFTDLVYYDDADGSVVTAKVPTTPGHPEEGCINAVDVAVPAAVLRSADFFLHGTTVGLNALLERRGEKIGMLTTAGFRDVIEIRNGSRGEAYNLFWRPKPPLVPRNLRIGIRERCRFDGQILEPLSRDDVVQACRLFSNVGVASVAIVFLHSYANPTHEREAARILREAGFSGHVSMSHAVSGEYRDYERASTTIIDAFVRARMSSYLDHIHTEIKRRNFQGRALMTRSGSGSMTFAEAQERPFETIMSGPVAGAEGAAELARRMKLPRLITADVGGTSFDACLIVDGRPKLLHSGEIDGMPIQSAWVDVRSIGAGGGSIAAVDAGGLLTVGPRSAGAVPGPACYGRGGTLPTTTDAACFLGMLGDGVFASDLRLDVAAAERAIASLTKPLNLSVEGVAQGIIAIAGSHMASLIRELTIEQGIDPREFTLLPFGGAGPMMATQIARELDIAVILIPRHAGNFSAWGLLGADLVRSRSRTRVICIDDASVAVLDSVIAELLVELSNETEDDRGILGVSLDLRYRGQEHTLPIVIPNEGGTIAVSAAEIESLFADEYRRLYGESLSQTVEMVNVRCSRRWILPARNEQPAEWKSSPVRSMQCYSLAQSQRTPFAIIDRYALRPNERHAGPAIICEPTATTYVDSDFSYGMDVSGCLRLQMKDEKK